MYVDSWKKTLTLYWLYISSYLYPHSTGGGGILFYLCPSVQDIFRRIFHSNYWWQKSYIWSQASYRYAILWEAFLDPSDSYFLFSDLVGFYTHWTYMRGYHKWTLAHSSSCLNSLLIKKHKSETSISFREIQARLKLVFLGFLFFYCFSLCLYAVIDHFVMFSIMPSDNC
jgi:hypothetical protein